MKNDQWLLLENQLCFSLYAASKEIIKLYQPFLSPLNLTYTQYICMMVLWEEKEISIKELGKKLLLDSGTLTPLLKKMEKNNLISRTRSVKDERIVNITLTNEGLKLKDKLIEVPCKIAEQIAIDGPDAITLKQNLDNIVESFRVK